MVIGHPGAGKSTLARELSRILKLPIIHLDREYWRPGWVMLDDSEWDDRAAALAGRERWIMDGSYDRTLHIRLPRADVVILLDFPRLLSTSRVIKRMLTNLGEVRPDMADGCPEKFELSFLKFVWNYHRDRMPTVKERIGKYLIEGTLIRLERPKETERLLSQLELTDN